MTGTKPLQVQSSRLNVPTVDDAEGNQRLDDPDFQKRSPKETLAVLLKKIGASVTPEKPIFTGADSELQRIRRDFDKLTAAEILAWVESGTADRAWRVSQMRDVAFGDSFEREYLSGLSKAGQFLMQGSEAEAGKEFDRAIKRFSDRSQKGSEIYVAALRLIDDDFVRDVLESELEIQLAAVEFSKALSLFNYCDRIKIDYCDQFVRESKNPFDFMATFAKKGLSSSSQKIAPNSRTFGSLLQQFSNVADQDVNLEELLLEAKIGEPLSMQEFVYVTFAGLYRSQPFNERSDFGVVCKRTEELAKSILLEDRLPERAAVQLGLLIQCNSEVASEVFGSIRQRQMSLPGWL